MFVDASVLCVCVQLPQVVFYDVLISRDCMLGITSEYKADGVCEDLVFVATFTRELIC